MITQEPQVQSLDLVAQAIEQASIDAEMPDRAVKIWDGDSLVWSWSWLMRRYYGLEVATVEVLSEQVGTRNVHLILRNILDYEIDDDQEEILALFAELEIASHKVHDFIDDVWQIPIDPEEMNALIGGLAHEISDNLRRAAENLNEQIAVMREIMESNLQLAEGVLTQLFDVSGELIGEAKTLDHVDDVTQQRMGEAFDDA